MCDRVLRKVFKINSILLEDKYTSKVYCENENNFFSSRSTHEIIICGSIFSSKGINMFITFSSRVLIENLRIIQRFKYKGDCIEQWVNTIGRVEYGLYRMCHVELTPAPEIRMMPSQILSGNLVVESDFYDGEMYITTSLTRIFYV